MSVDEAVQTALGEKLLRGSLLFKDRVIQLMKVPKLSPEATFTLMIWEHDVSFDFSNDGRVWRRGQAELKEIERASIALPVGAVTETWNRIIGLRFPGDKIFLRPRQYWESLR